MRVNVVTLFVDMCQQLLEHGVVGRAVGQGMIDVQFRDLREFGHGKHRRVDDKPYGGGAGMVMQVDCIVACLEAIDGAGSARAHRVLLSPQGQPLTQRRVEALVKHDAITLVCGRYEGFDERVRDYVDEEISLGDFVLSGGELAAMAIIDACARLVPGVLGNAESLSEESHSAGSGGLLEYPQYTRPVDFRGATVPDVLLSGDHARIAAWRREQAAQRTALRRPDITKDEDGA